MTAFAAQRPWGIEPGKSAVGRVETSDHFAGLFCYVTRAMLRRDRQVTAKSRRQLAQLVPNIIVLQS